MNSIIFFVPPIIGAVIGYLTNVLAIKLLFHPKKPVRVLGFKIQGLIPAKSDEFAKRFIDLVEDYVQKEDFKNLIDEAITRAFMESKLAAVILNVLDKYGFGERIAKNVRQFLVNIIVENINFRKFLEEKISDFSAEEAEEIFKKFAKKEMRFIEISGAVLGFIIGLVQSLILL